MANIMDYLVWRGDLSFFAAPFNEVDNLIFTQLVYLEFAGIVPGVGEKCRISLCEAGEQYLKKADALPTETRQAQPKLQRDAAELLRAMQQSRRFARCQLSCYVNEISDEEESQFSAMKIELEDGSVYLAFRGTDNSVAGWKENFNMSFLKATPGQKKAVQYVESTVPFYKNRLRFGGHSKGGNLAVYAAMYASPFVQQRILQVYNNDGPGFLKATISQEGYQRILPKVRTILPQSSVIGMLLEHEEAVDIIESSGEGILQHDAFTWKLNGPAFVPVEALTQDSQLLDQSLKEWIYSLNAEQRKAFVDTLFGVLVTANIRDTDELGRLNWQKFSDLIRATRELSPQEREILSKTLQRLAQIYNRNVMPQAEAIFGAKGAKRVEVPTFFSRKRKDGAPAEKEKTTEPGSDEEPM